MSRNNIFALFLITSVMFLVGCGADVETDEGISTDLITNPGMDGEIEQDLPAMSFNEELHDFGQIIQGENCH